MHNFLRCHSLHMVSSDDLSCFESSQVLAVCLAFQDIIIVYCLILVYISGDESPYLMIKIVRGGGAVFYGSVPFPESMSSLVAQF